MLKKGRMCLLLIALLTIALACPSGAGAAEDTVSLMTIPSGRLQVDGEIAVWMAPDGGKFDIYCLNRQTGEQKQITNDSATQGYPDVAGNYIVWQDDRNHFGSFDIYLYDLAIGTETMISKIAGNHQEPIIAGNKVAWIDHQSGNKDVMLYDIATDTVRKISADNAEAFGLLFDGEVAAWTDTRNTSFDVYYYEVAKGIEQRLTRGFEDESADFVYDGKIIYSAYYNPPSKQIFMYDTNMQMDTRVTTGEEVHESLAFNGEFVIVEVDNHQLELSAVDTFSETKLAAPGAIPKQAFMIGDEVVWYDGKGVTSEDLSAAVDRAKLSPTTLTSSNSSSGAPEQVPDDAKKYLVKADADTVITSDDGKMSLSISKGSFDTDTAIFLKQSPPTSINNFLPFTPVYEWWVEGNPTPKQPLQLTITYTTQGMDSPLSMGIFDLTASQPKAMQAHRNKEASKLAATVGSHGKVSLMVYNKSFKDMKQHWAAQTVSCVASHQIINGYADGSYRPDYNMTRAEFVKVLVSSVGDTSQASGTGTFNDVKLDFWAAPYIDTAYEKGWVTGYNGRFNPDASITRQEMAAILIRVLADIDPDDTPIAQDISTFADNSQISNWAREPMSMAVGMGIIQGYNNRISPDKNATRAEAATMLYRYLDGLGRL